MSEAITLQLQAGDWLSLFGHFLMLSLLSVGGAVTTIPEVHRYLVTQQHWLNDTQFNASIAISQGAPGPNLLFVALMGWHVGLNGGGMLSGLLGVGITMLGILLPSTTLTYIAARWLHHNRSRRSVRAFKLGMAPIIIALLFITSWIMASGHSHGIADWPLWALTLIAAIVVWRSRLHLLWLIGGGALLGWFGWV